jgi:transcription antitermination factor NusG
MSEHSAVYWYAIRVKSNRERIVSTALKQRDIEEFLPAYQTSRVWSDRVKSIEAPLFPGYVFCRMDIRRRLPVLQIPGVVGFVGNGREPLPVEDNEIAGLQAISKAGVLAAPWPFLQAGQRVRIERGSLRDVEGLLIEVKNQHRLVISITLLQRSVAVELDRDCIVPVGPRNTQQRPASRLHVRPKLQVA